MFLFLKIFQDCNLSITKMFDEQQMNEEQEFVIPPQPQLQFKLFHETQGKIKCEVLCVGFYGISSLYVSTLIDTKAVKPSNRINFQKAKQKSLASIYISNEGNLAYLIFNEQFQKMKEIHLSRFISNNFIANKILLFTSKARGMLEKDSPGDLKYIATSAVSDKLVGSKYPQGLNGPEADIIQWGEIQRIPVIVYIGLYNQYEIQRQQIQETYGLISGNYGLESKYEITSEIKKFNMQKYSNKLYL